MEASQVKVLCTCRKKASANKRIIPFWPSVPCRRTHWHLYVKNPICPLTYGDRVLYTTQQEASMPTWRVQVPHQCTGNRVE